MSATTIQNLEKMLAAGKDSALLRFSLGNEYLKEGLSERAVEQLEHAVRLDPNYSAAWKSLGKALAAAGRPSPALDAFRQGIVVAQTRGDIQAAKEMTVFAKRMERILST